MCTFKTARTPLKTFIRNIERNQKCIRKIERKEKYIRKIEINEKHLLQKKLKIQRRHGRKTRRHGRQQKYEKRKHGSKI